MKRIAQVVCVAASVLAMDVQSALAQELFMSGNIGYARKGRKVDVAVQYIVNLRPASMFSGTLYLQLWASAAPYTPGQPINGYKMAEIAIQGLQGQHYYEDAYVYGPFDAPRPGTYYTIMALAERQGDQLVTWDGYSFGPTRYAPLVRRNSAGGVKQRRRTKTG
jgi:hypothetical protein